MTHISFVSPSWSPPTSIPTTSSHTHLSLQPSDASSLVIFLPSPTPNFCTRSKERSKLAQNSVVGPIFVSIGDAEKLNKFLDLNPAVPRDLAFVDDYSFAAYESAGLGVAGKDMDTRGTKLTNPGLSMQQWWSYVTNVVGLSPVPKDLKFGEVPAGVLRLGGTFVVRGDEVLYAWKDKIPGDHPDINEVVKTAIEAAK